MQVRYGKCSLFVLLAAASAFGAGGAASAGCDGKTVLFADDFNPPSKSWGPAGSTVFRGGKYVATVDPNGSVADWPGDVTFSGPHSICAQVKLPNDPQSAAGSGILFWISSEKNQLGQRDRYMAMVSPDGYYWVARSAKGERSEIVESVQSSIVRTGPDAVNEISVDLTETGGVLSINGREVGRFSGQAPKQSFAGITAGAPLDKKHVVEFSRFRVVKP